ncbi:MAG TPA: dihydroneopterin aldolase [Quisquiliibacterium sp.]|nr:dihydroneopterin aldolase [Quisquiliibacterium sp.]
MNALLDPRLGDCRRIFLHDFALEASIGFHDFELAAKQRVLISVELFVPLHASLSSSDHVSETLDYDLIRRDIAEWARSRHFNLQETLLDGIVDLCMAQPSVRAVRASTEKPDVYPDCRTVGVEVFRFRL